MKLFGREPALYIAVLASIITVGGTLGFDWLTGEQASLAVIAVNAVAGAIHAYTVRPISPGAFTYAVGAIASLFGAYGFSLSDATVGAINAAVVSILALITRGQVAPRETKISHA